MAEEKKVIAITLPGDLWKETQDYAESLGYIVERRVFGNSSKEIVAAVSKADAVVAAIHPYTKEVIDRLENVRILSRIGVGYDNIDVAAATDKKIAVTITPGANASAVAEMTVALLLDTARKVSLLDRIVRAGGGYGGPLQLTSQLQGKVVGLLGFGNVGRNLIKLISGFQCRVLVYDPYVERSVIEQFGAEAADLDAIKTNCDFISLHLPCTEETVGFINADFFKAMKKSAILINTARGHLVDEEAMISALKSGEIAGAGLDVFVHEPLEPDSELRNLDNVVLTPHYAAMTFEAFNRMGLSAIDNIHEHLRGNRAAGIVNPEIYQSLLT